ncbi:hypothetical protein ACIOWK_32545 [Pseudomonas protegens]|uniref:hypothetical protein n=1 Tax=Pseudomonas protegens TaxID=380021 RepID=UPI0037F26EC4
MSDKIRESYKMRRAKLAGLLIQDEDWPGAYRRADEILSWSCFEAGRKASRESLVVELRSEDGMDGHLCGPDVVEAIESLGLRVKP